MATIKIISGANAGETYSLEGRETMLGRHPDCQVVLKDSTVSRRHARFVKQDDHYVIDDVGSQHGTRLNGEIIRSPERLYDKDEVQISQVRVVFRLTPEEGGSKTDRPSTIITSVDVLGDAGITDDSHTAPRWRALLDITRSLGVSLDLKLILPNVLENIFRILPEASRGCIMVSERLGEEPRPYAIKNPGSKANAPPPISRTITNTVMSECKAVLSTDAGDDERFQSSDSVLDLKMRSVLCAPLVGAADEAFGMIHLDAQDLPNSLTPTISTSSSTSQILLARRWTTLDCMKHSCNSIAANATWRRPGKFNSTSYLRTIRISRAIRSPTITSQPMPSAAITLGTRSCPTDNSRSRWATSLDTEFRPRCSWLDCAARRVIAL